MSRVDPRETYDDLILRRSRDQLPPEEFAAHAGSEAATIGWVVLGCVFDATGRVLLLDEPWAEGWKLPAGVPKPDESLAAAVVREVREETGVPITTGRPHAVEDYTVVDEATGDTAGWTVVVFDATATATDIKADLGLDDEDITDARWFDGLPQDIFHSLTRQVYSRCMDDRLSGRDRSM